MSFNTEDLTLLALGIRDDKPVDSEQPPLVNGVHLRWYPRQDLGFPWYGFYLFRRESQPRRPRCLSGVIAGLRPGPSRSTSLRTRLGRLVSQRPLLFTEDFPATATVEIDLAGGVRFELPEGVEAGGVEVRIGFRPTVERKCIDFRRFPLGPGVSPRTEQGVVFETETPQVSPPLAVTVVEQWSGSLPGLNSSRRLEITLPREASRVDLIVTNRLPVRIEALTEDGRSVASRDLARGELQAGTVSLTGAGITRVILDCAAVDAALLHEICFETPSGGPRESKVGVRAFSRSEVVARTVVSGLAGQVVSALLEAGGITAVEIDPGPAALVDLCYVPVRQGVVHGWEEIPGFTYPLCLPVDHADYPCPGRPASFDEAKALALSRVTYRAPAGWDSEFLALHDELVVLVQGGPSGPGGGPMAGRTHDRLTGHSLSPATQSDVPTIPGLHPLELVLLGSLQPAIAQMLGLYFVDTTAAADIPYDYLLLADPSGVLGGSAASALEWLAFTADATQVDADIVLGSTVTLRPPIAPPGEGRAYALPGPATRMIDGNLPKSAGNVGLWWPLPADSTTEEQPDRIVFYYPKRASFGPAEPASPPADSAYQPLRNGAPFLVSEPDPTNPPTAPNPRSSDWPPPTIPIHLVDGSLAEGWYSYRLAGQDLFGRRSGLGPPARWYEWTPASERHAFAVALLDKVPPPIPLGVEAWALDPPDAWVLADEAYTAWRHDHPDLVGLRVRWRWTFLQRIQAPDTREFRIYYQAGRWNALLGRIVKVVAVADSDTESEVDLDFADSHPPGKFTGARLRVGNDDFEILNSQPGAALRLRVKNIGVKDKIIRPTEGKPCTVAIPETHALWVDTGLAETWAKRLAFVPYDPPLRTVFDPSKDRNGQPLTSANAVFQTIQPIVTGADVYFPPVPVVPPTPDSPRDPDLSDLQPWIDHLWLRAASNAEEAHPIERYNATTRTVTLKDVPTLAGSPVAWILGRPTREYEIFLPAPDVGDGHPFEPSLAEPTVYAQIAVSAADDKIHTKDDPKWNDPDRYGNESRLSPSATVFRVLWKEPEPPELVDLGDRLYATPADYHNRSYSTFRFNDPQKPLRVHILRALDDSLFRRDWLIRETRKALDPVPDPDAPEAKTEHLDFFPDDVPAWDFSRRKTAADAVNALANGASYSSLSDDAWAVLALLPGNERQPDRPALEKHDTHLRSLRGELVDFAADFCPQSWTPATRNEAAQELDRINDPADYLALSDRALRLLAALPGNEESFSRVTLQPLQMSDREIEDQRRPDDDASYTPKLDRRAYMDTLPGRSTNRYLYRALFVDGAQNQSALSLPGPPVWLPDTATPVPPVISSATGGDQQAILRWTSSNESSILRTLIYRTTDEETTWDARLLGTPRANLPARVLVVGGGAVDLGAATDIALVERVYAAQQLQPFDDPFIGASATQYLSASVVQVGAVVSVLGAPEGVEVVVVYRDSQQTLQRTPVPGLPDYWCDVIPAGVPHFYALASIKTVDVNGQKREISSALSKVVVAKSFDISPPASAQWVRAERVKVDGGGMEHPFSDTLSDFTPAAHLVWIADPGSESMLERKVDGALTWNSLTPWSAASTDHRDDTVEFGRIYRYRIKSRKRNGLTANSIVSLPLEF